MTSEDHNQSLPPLSDLDRLVHEPARLMILANLYVVESADFTFLMNQTGLTLGNLSSHLSKLESAGYIRIEKDFVARKPHTMMSLTNDGRDAFRLYRQQMERFMQGIV